MSCSRWLGIGAFMILFAAPSAAQTTAESFSMIVGHWDLVGTTTQVKIHPNGAVDHSLLGAGTLRQVEFNLFQIRFRHKNDLRCDYRAARYSKEELHLIIATQPSPQDCELGSLRQTPGTEKSGDMPISPPEASKKSSAALPTEPMSVFKDCDLCPDMVVVPAGRFEMGSADTEAGRYPVEGPVRTVAFAKSFAAGRYPVTVNQYRTFIAETGRSANLGCHIQGKTDFVLDAGRSVDSPGFDQGDWHPVVCVNWHEANAYIDWLSKKVGRSYRLLSEAESEYVARAGTRSPYWWGDQADPRRAWFDAAPTPVSGGEVPNPPASKGLATSSSSPAAIDIPKPRQGTVAVTAGQPNPWGFYHVHGNAASWTADCWSRTLGGLPTNGEASVAGDCSRRSVRGGAWTSNADDIRSAYREPGKAANRYYQVGFRLGLSLSD